MAREIDGMEKKELQSRMVHRYNERFQLPLGLAVLCLALEGLLSDRRRALRDAWARLRAAWRGRRFLPPAGRRAEGRRRFERCVTIPGSPRARWPWPGWPSPGGVFRDALHESTTEGRRLYDAGKYAEAMAAYGRGRAEEPDNPVLAFNVGDTLLAMGKADEALAEYRKALSSEDPKLKARTQYNIGNAYLQKEDLRRAIDAYRQSLLQDAAQKDAKRNLELALQKLKEQQEKEKQSKDQAEAGPVQKQDQQKQGQSGDSKQSKDQQGKDQQNQQAKDSQGQQGQEQQSKEQHAARGQKQDAGRPRPSHSRGRRTRPPGWTRPRRCSCCRRWATRRRPS